MALRSVQRFRIRLRLHRHGAPLAVAALSVAAACADPFSTARSPAPRGSTGQELFGLVCDRVGAQSLREDLTGASFHAVCHPDAAGSYASTVDQSLLPAADPGAVDVHGNPVSLAAQNTNRALDVARVEALARRRADLIAAFDAVFPDTQVPVVDVANADPTLSCTPKGTDSLNNQLLTVLSNFLPLYDDGTVPQSTESIAPLFDAVKIAADAQTAFARFEARQGYRPLQVSLGVARPAIAYGQLRDLTNTALALLSSDSRPYDRSKLDAHGGRIAIPGPANPQLNSLIAAAHDELLYATQDPALPPLSSATDAIGRTALSRGWSDLELLERIFYTPGFGSGGTPKFIARRDPRGYASVKLLPGGGVPAPFVDDGTGFAKVDGAGQFVTSDGSTPPSPFLTADSTGGSFDSCARSLRGGAVAAGDAGASGSGSPADAGDAGPGAPSGTSCGVADSQLFYDYVDTTDVLAANLMQNVKPLANPDPAAKHETLMYALAGAPLLFGTRDGSAKSSKCYAPDPANPSSCKDPTSLLAYDAFETDTSAILDLVYAFGQMLGDPTMDETLSYVESLFDKQLPKVARLTGDALAMKASANNHAEAKIPASSTFWDEMLDVTVELEQEPGLLEDVLKALGQDATRDLGQVFASYMTLKDEMSYDPAHLNGPPLNVTLGQAVGMSTPVDRSSPDTGFNRSAMQRFLSLIHDTNGVTACNKEGSTNNSTDSNNWTGVVHAKGLPIGDADVCGTADGSGTLCKIPIVGTQQSAAQPFHECEVFKIENLAKFYLDAIVEGTRDPTAQDPKASIYFRPNILRNGISILGLVNVGASNVSIIEQSSGIGLNANSTYGFWDDTSKQIFRPRPQWLNRLVFFDQVNDTQNATTQKFLVDLQGSQIGSSVCPERVIDDPCNNQSGCGGNQAANVSPDGKVHGLRACADGDWLGQRGKGTIFVWEEFGFYQAITPLLTAFVSHGREDIFIDLMETLYRHWADAQATADECLLSSDPAAAHPQCSKDGLVTYEPLLAEDLQGDILGALHDLEPVLESQTIQSCTAADPGTGLCSAGASKDGITVLAAATRALVDPKHAAAVKLVDRHNGVTAPRNDGTTNPQVTPIYLLVDALDAMDAAFAAQTSPNPADDRLAQWRLARSQLVDQFLKVDGTGPQSTFDNAALPRLIPAIVDPLRAQLLARCPATFTPPGTARCAWARDQLAAELQAVVHGPTFAATMDLLEAIRTDAPSRAQVGQLLEYLLDAASDNDALANLLASASDMVQLFKDDTNLVPVYKALAPTLAPTSTDAQGATHKSAIDANLALLGRLSGRALDANGKEICASEVDPNQVLTLALKNLVTPMNGANGKLGQAPIQTIMDVIGDVNRADPSQTSKFQATDYASIADQVSQFLEDKQRGIEQFYAIVKNGTVKR